VATRRCTSCPLANQEATQGRFTSLGSHYTIARERAVADDAGILFARGFYDSLAAGRDVESSFRQGVLWPKCDRRKAFRISGQNSSKTLKAALIANCRFAARTPSRHAW
jgi:hypothetical protein